MTSTGLATLSVERATAMIAKCRTVDEVRDIRDKAKAIAAYQRTRGASIEGQQDLAEIVVRAELRLGELCAETVQRGNPEKRKGTSAVPLRDRGISKNQSSRWQRAARVPKEVREEFIAAARKKGIAPTTTALAALSTLPRSRQRDVIARSSTKTGNVRALARQAEKAVVGARLNAEPAPLPTGPFHVIVSDPPWAYDKRVDDATHRGDTPYPPMKTAAICALPVAAMAHRDCILWLWTTNAFMRDAFVVLDAWGFAEKTILTWAKDRMGLGDWLRGKTEHCILATRGRPTVTLTNQTTLLQGAVREHSRKPESFYRLVETLCPGSKVEMFAREKRKGWAQWGAESEKFA